LSNHSESSDFVHSLRWANYTPAIAQIEIVERKLLFLRRCRRSKETSINYAREKKHIMQPTADQKKEKGPIGLGKKEQRWMLRRKYRSSPPKLEIFHQKLPTHTILCTILEKNHSIQFLGSPNML
jgi:hypothetical protein